MLERQWRREETERVTGLQEPSLAAVGCRAGIDAPIGFIFVQVKQEKSSAITDLFVCHFVTSDACTCMCAAVSALYHFPSTNVDASRVQMSL